MTIKEARKAAGLTQFDLAVKSGVKLSTLQKLESGANDPRGAAAETICRLARAMGVTAEQLILDGDDAADV